MNSKEIKLLVDKYINRFNKIPQIDNVLMSDDIRKALDIGLITNDMANNKKVLSLLNKSKFNVLEVTKPPYFIPLDDKDFIYWKKEFDERNTNFTLEQYLRLSAFKFEGKQMFDQEKSVNWNLALNNSFMVQAHNVKVEKIMEVLGGKHELSLSDLEKERVRYKSDFVSVLKDFIVEASDGKLTRETFAYSKDYEVLNLFKDKNKDSLYVLLNNKVLAMTSSKRDFTSLSETRLRKVLRLFLVNKDEILEDYL